jgi:adhesin transport system membrane fusion protein
MSKISEIKKQQSKSKQTLEVFHRHPAADLDLATDIRTSILVQTPRGGQVIVWLTLVLFICAVAWAYVSEIEEVTRGNGKVVPSRQLQVIQNLEGGILSEILVHVGDIVEKDQLLLRIDEKRFSAPYQESRYNYLALHAKIARLEAETYDSEFVIPEEVLKENPQVGQREKTLFNSRREELQEKLGALTEQINQRQQEVSELKAKINDLRRTRVLLTKEVELTRPLVEAGVVAEVEFLRLKRQDSEMLGEITASELALPRALSKLKEAERNINEETLSFSNRAKEELNKAFTELESLTATSVALSDRLRRTAVVSPVRGIVNQIFINTVGGVIQPGMDLVQIVPLDDTLLVDAKIKPADIAFIAPNLKATVKFSAYDFIIYGGLQAKVERIGADSIVDENGDSFYLVTVRTEKNYLGSEKSPLPIIPGMVATVDVLTGKKSILTYLLKPILRAKNLALRER